MFSHMIFRCVFASLLISGVQSALLTSAMNGHVYQLFFDDDNRAYFASRQYCRELGGYLVSVNTPEEHDFIDDEFGRTNPDPTGSGDQLSLGLSTNTCSDDDCSQGWKWEDGTNLSSWSNWGQNQPINNERI